MSNTTKIVIQLIPILVYVTALLWTNELINRKIIPKPDRKKYKKYFNERLGSLFLPIISGMAILMFFLNNPVPKETIHLTNFIIKIILVLIQFALAIIVFPKVRRDVKDILNSEKEELMRRVNN